MGEMGLKVVSDNCDEPSAFCAEWLEVADRLSNKENEISFEDIMMDSTMVRVHFSNYLHEKGEDKFMLLFWENVNAYKTKYSGLNEQLKVCFC